MSSYGITSAIQIVNIFLTVVPFIYVAFRGVYQQGFSPFFQNLSENYFELLLGLLWFAIVFLFNVIRSPYLLYEDASRRIAELDTAAESLNQRIQPRLTLEFDNSTPCVQRMNDHVLLRMGVRNLSESDSLKNVVVQLDRIAPSQYGLLPLVLRQMHDHHPQSVFLQSFDLGPAAVKYVDVISIYNISKTRSFHIEHAARNVPKEAISSITHLTLTAITEQSRKLTETFSVEIKNNGATLMRTA